MSNTYRPRRVLAVLAALVLPAATCGVAPALRDLILRTERLEKFVANAKLPPVLVDDHGGVVGQVLEYNDVMLYSSAAFVEGPLYWGKATAWNRPPSIALATVLYEVPGQSPVALEANRDALRTPVRGTVERFYFESSDCTGTPWILGPDGYADGLAPAANVAPSVFGYGRIGPPGQTLYTADLDAEGEFVWALSRLDVTNGSGGTPREQTACHSIHRSGRLDMLPLHPAADLSGFTPPFRLEDQRQLWLR